jgi:hypothetical protein
MQPDPMNVSTEQRRLFRYLIPEQPSSSVNRAGREVHLGSSRRSGVIVPRAGISGTDAQIPLLAIGFPLVSSSRPSKRPVVKTAYQRPASTTRINDPHHSGGYRELRSNAEAAQLQDRRPEQKCAICQEAFTNLWESTPSFTSYPGERSRSGIPWRRQVPSLTDY